MIYLILAIVTSLLVAITIKSFDKFNIDSFQAIGFNYMICIAAAITIHSDRINIQNIPTQPWFVFALMLGFGFIAMFNVFAISTSKIGLALTSVFSKMSVLIPVYFGIILYGDKFDLYKILGLIFTILAFYFIFKKDKNIPFRKLYFILPLLLFTGNGFNDSLQTYCRRIFNMENDAILLFMITIYTTALTIGILIFAYRRIFMNYRIQQRNIVAGIVLGIFNFTTTFFFIKCIGFFESTFVFPVFNVSLVSLTTLAGVIFFKERLRTVNWIGMALAMLAIIVIAIG